MHHLKKYDEIECNLITTHGEIQEHKKLSVLTQCFTIMTQSVPRPFPLLEINNRDIDKYRCLWASEDKKERCIASFCTFDHFICHLTEDHDLSLKPDLDFCKNCETIFDLYMEGVEHYINHAINCEDTSWKKLGDLETRDVWVHNVFEKLKEIRKELLEHLLFIYLENETL